MNETSSFPTVCPRCGASLLKDAPEGLCPRCLAAVNFETGSLFTGGKSPLPPPPIEEIAPHFPQLEVVSCLGRGGMGVVYKARQKSLDRLVALKLLAPEREKDPAFSERFVIEAQALAKMSHPNIVTVYDFGQAGGFFYLLMEYVDGVNLRQLLQSHRLTPEQAFAVVPPLCDALQYAHDRGIVHRDIKPENLLIDREGRIKVADFGLAKMLGSEASLDEEPVGTPSYMAPEQIENTAHVDNRADIYSLGVVFYEMLTGELPGQGIEPPSKKVQIDVRLDEIVLRALEKKPELRYQQASVLKTQVETIAQTPGSSKSKSDTHENPRSATHEWLHGFFGALGISSPAALKCARLSALGFLGFVGFIPGLEKLRGLFGLSGLLGFAVIVELFRRKKRDTMDASRNAPRLSRTTIAGACIAFTPFFIGILGPMITGALGPTVRGVSWIVVISQITVLFLCTLTTILGWIGVSQIRRSGGKIYGLALAVFVGLLFPLLAMDGAIGGTVFLLFRRWMRTSVPAGLSASLPVGTIAYQSSQMFSNPVLPVLIGIGIAASVDILIIRLVHNLLRHALPFKPLVSRTSLVLIGLLLPWAAIVIWLLTFSGPNKHAVLEFCFLTLLLIPLFAMIARKTIHGSIVIGILTIVLFGFSAISYQRIQEKKEASKNAYSDAMSFSPMMERQITWKDADEDGLVFFQMDTGICLKPPFRLTVRRDQGIFVEITPELRQWIAAHNVDLLLRMPDPSWGLMNLKMQTAYVGPPTDWEKVFPNQILDALRKNESHAGSGEVPGFTMGSGTLLEFGQCFAFQTRNNVQGIYSLGQIEDGARYDWKIRIKLLQRARSSPTASPSIFGLPQSPGRPPRSGVAKSDPGWRVSPDLEDISTRTHAALSYPIRIPAMGPPAW